MLPIGLYLEGLILSWASGARQGLLGAGWREPHRGTWREWGLLSKTWHALASMSMEGPRTLGLGETASSFVPRPCALSR